MGKILVVVYSRSGHTSKAVQELSKYLDCDVETLIDKKSRKGIIGYIAGGRDALGKKLTDIEAVKFEPSQYEKVVLCTPTWASNMAPAVRTYIEKYKADIKQAAFLVTQGGACNGKVYEYLQEAVGKEPVYKTNIGAKEFRDGSWVQIVSGFAQEISK